MIAAGATYPYRCAPARTYGLRMRRTPRPYTDGWLRAPIL